MLRVLNHMFYDISFSNMGRYVLLASFRTTLPPFIFLCKFVHNFIKPNFDIFASKKALSVDFKNVTTNLDQLASALKFSRIKLNCRVSIDANMGILCHVIIT
ncbi:hypothetical protein RF11_05150 [Thelohanellus kitauei]|uniref:Uncharacterized protein n=1 Tax=Thelohanellus kitauei TaxID=669202 RepID=A0A0C2IPH0_THEKT|nr:hypothetical protein RF11_05150 [Thelohanellus kitauei]